MPGSVLDEKLNQAGGLDSSNANAEPAMQAKGPMSDANPTQTHFAPGVNGEDHYASGNATPKTREHGHGWRARRKAHHHARKEKRAHKAADAVEKGLPSMFHSDEDKHGGKDRFERASKRMRIKNEFVAALAEFIGTFLFLFIAFGVANSASQGSIIASGQGGNTTANGGLDPSALLLSSLGFGFSLATQAWAFFRVSGGLFNPAVTFALFLTGAVDLVRMIILTIIQFAAAISAAGIAQVLIPGGINVRTRLGASTTIAQGFFIEFFMTANLILAVFLLAGEKHKGTFLAPVGIGLALFIAELFATSLTGGSLNPARTLGPDVIASTFDGTTWIYYAAPYSAALVASGIYKLLLWLNYYTAVEGQDSDGVHLLMRDKDGKATGFVDQVTAADAPEIERMREAEFDLERQTSHDTVGTSTTAPRSAVPRDNSQGALLPAPVVATQTAFTNVGVAQ